jgi:hypothetical protein
MVLKMLLVSFLAVSYFNLTEAYSITVDNTDPDFRIVSGDWNESTRDPFFYLTNYLWNAAGDGSDKVEWKLDIRKSGKYEVYVRWVASSPDDRASSAPYTLQSGSETRVIRVNMKDLTNQGKWFKIGEMVFTVGVENKIILSDDTDNSVVADAVKVVYVDAISEGEVIFEDDFSNANTLRKYWRPETRGDGTVEIRDGRMYAHGSRDSTQYGSMFIWYKEDLPKDFQFEFDFHGINNDGFHLLFFNVMGWREENVNERVERDIFCEYHWLRGDQNTPHGPKHESSLWRKYVGRDGSATERIRCYHISYSRGTSTARLLRKNPGKFILSERSYSRRLYGETYRITLTKKGARIKLTVNGPEVDNVVFVDQIDDGTASIGGVYEGGKIALRQVYNSETYYDNVKLINLTESEGIEKGAVEEGIKLGGVYPNPFNPECWIPLNGKCKKKKTKCKIYNILGQLVREIEISNLRPQISQSIYWDGRDNRGLAAPSGMYFYEVVGEGVRQMVLLK